MNTTSWGDASALLADAGVAEDASYYRQFTRDRERAALTVAMRIQAAWKVNDPDAFADVFTENGSLLMRDEQLTSREDIRSYMTRGFQGPLKGAHVKGWPIAVTFLGDDVAMFVTEGGILMPGDREIQDSNLIRATWVVVRQPDGRLGLVSHQGSPIKG
ncbi:SgcJ/EcaC family oxidoreductase [Dactylosporangium sp. NPDC000555]|uniref:SgcJ/EcaC family oxidoreductase n=1 Tax=Dactylosporangium sp. NPDC000555 TaxID=3154260 RepID=UPI0033290BB0